MTDCQRRGIGIGTGAGGGGGGIRVDLGRVLFLCVVCEKGGGRMSPSLPQR